MVTYGSGGGRLSSTAMARRRFPRGVRKGGEKRRRRKIVREKPIRSHGGVRIFTHKIVNMPIFRR